MNLKKIIFIKKVSNTHQGIYQKIAHYIDSKIDARTNIKINITTTLNDVNMNIVEKDVDDLIAAGIKKLGTDEAKFNEIFAKRR